MVDVARLIVEVDTTDLKAAEAHMKTFVATGKAAEIQTEKLSKSSQRAGKAAAGGGANWRNLGLQLNQVSQQTAATGNFMNALSIQMPDILLGFGAIGIAAGIAAPAIFSLAQEFLFAGEEAFDLDKAMEALSDTMANADGLMKTLSLTADELSEKYGFQAERVRDLARLQAELALIDAEAGFRKQITVMDDVIERFTDLKDTIDRVTYASSLAAGLGQITNELGLAGKEAIHFQELLFQIQDGATFEMQQDALHRMAEFLDDANVSLSEMPDDLRAAVQEIIALSNETDRAAAVMERLAAAASNVSTAGGRGSVVPNAMDVMMMGMGGEFVPGRAKSGRGGGGRKDPFENDLQRLTKQLMTERETIDAWYNEGQSILADRRAQEVLGEQQHKDAMLDLETEYQERLAGIRSGYGQGAVSDAETFFGAMASAAAAGGNKMLKVARVTGAAQALANSWIAFTEVLKDPSLPWFARIPAATGILAAGMNAVSAIKSGSGGGIGGVGPGVTGGSAEVSRVVNVHLGGDDMFSGATVRKFLDQIAEETNAGGRVVIA